MNREDFLRDCWAYYMMLEEKFINTLDFVALSTDNEAAYSNEYAGLIQMIGAEMDSFFKEYCGFALTDNKNISHYYPVVTANFPDVTNQEVHIRMADMTIKPFDGWNEQQPKRSLFWWEAFDNIKHSRIVNKKDGCQKTTLYALAALYLLEMKYLQKITDGTQEPDIPNEKPKIFTLPNWTFNFLSAEDVVMPLHNSAVVLDGGNASS